MVKRENDVGRCQTVEEDLREGDIIRNPPGQEGLLRMVVNQEVIRKGLQNDLGNGAEAAEYMLRPERRAKLRRGLKRVAVRS